MSNQRGSMVYGTGDILLIVASLVFLCGCSQVDVSGHIRYRKTISENLATQPYMTRSSVVGFGYDRINWDTTKSIPAEKGRVVLIQPGSPADQGAGFIFKINDKGDFILGTSNALAWNQSVGTCKLQFVSYLTLGIGGSEYRLPKDMKPMYFKISEGKTHWLLFSVNHTMIPFLTPIGEKHAEKLLANKYIKKSALPKNIEDDIQWLP